MRKFEFEDDSHDNTAVPQRTYIQDFRNYPKHLPEENYPWILPARVACTVDYWEKMFVPDGYRIDVKRRGFDRLKQHRDIFGNKLKHYWIVTLKPPYIYTEDWSNPNRKRCKIENCPMHTPDPINRRPKIVTVNENRQYFEDYIPPF